jgi:hypothetical protein
LALNIAFFLMRLRKPDNSRALTSIQSGTAALNREARLRSSRQALR